MDEFQTAGSAFVPVSDPMRPLDVFMWKKELTWWQKIVQPKGSLVVAIHLGSVAKGYHAWVVSDHRGVRIASVPASWVKEAQWMQGYRFSGYQPRRDMSAVWRAALTEGSRLSDESRTDQEVIQQALKLFKAIFDIPSGIIEFYDGLDKFEKEGPFRRIV